MDVWSILLGLGVLLLTSATIVGLLELTTISHIKPPKQQSFLRIRYLDTQLRNIAVPALGALASGFLISLSATFLHEGLTTPNNEQWSWAGLGSLVAAPLVLFATLSVALKGTGDAAESANDPFKAKAAAEHSATSPRHLSMNPEQLTEQLDGWEKGIARHCLLLTLPAKNSRLRALEEELKSASERRGFWRALLPCVKVYFQMVVRFPGRFSWALIGLASWLTGALSLAISALDSTESWRALSALLVFVVLGVLPMLFYGAARGNSARLWYRVYSQAIDAARLAITQAEKAHVLMREEDQERQQEQQQLTDLLQRLEQIEPDRQKVHIRIGRLEFTAAWRLLHGQP